MAKRACMERRGKVGRAVLSVVLLGGVLAFPVTAGVCQVAPASQAGPATNTRPGLNSNQPFGAAPDGVVGPNPRRLEHMREDERHKRLVADTARLVELTNELKAELEKASKDELSLDVVRKAAEIEKLAHDVKERMKS